MYHCSHRRVVGPQKLTTFIAPLFLVAAMAVTGCGKKKLDKNVDRLMKALQDDDYKSFESQSRPQLLSDFGRQKFKMLSKAINLLGKFKERTMKGIHVKNEGWKEGKYDLEFEKGEIHLRITLKNGKLVGFEFTGDPIENAMKKAKAELYKKFKVLGFRFVDEKGQEKSNVIKKGEKIFFQVGVAGLIPKDGNMHLRADLQVLGENNIVVYQKMNFLNTKIPLKKNDPPVATVKGNLTIPKAGSFKISLRIIDLVNKKALTHQQAFKAE